MLQYFFNNFFNIVNKHIQTHSYISILINNSRLKLHDNLKFDMLLQIYQSLDEASYNV